MKYPILSFLLCVVAWAPIAAQSSFIAENSNGTLVTFDYHFCFEEDTVVGGMGVTVGYSYLGKYDASFSFSAAGGISPVNHNCRVFRADLGYYFIKQGRESQNPISMAIRFGFDALIADAGRFRYRPESDPDGIIKCGLELSHFFGSWSSFAQPSIQLLWTKPVGSDLEAKLESRFGLAIMFSSEGNDNFVLYPRYSIIREVHELTFTAGFVFR